jgi:hypothetical protein
VIDHPLDNNKFLIHAFLEGSESGVYYRGEVYVDGQVIVNLPDYVKKLANIMTVYVTPIIGEDDNTIPFVTATTITKNKFKIKVSQPCMVNWLVFGKRENIVVEVDKDKVTVEGNELYKWIK